MGLRMKAFGRRCSAIISLTICFLHFNIVIFYHCCVQLFQLFQLFVGSKLQPYATRPTGGLGIHWNLHISADENNMFFFLYMKA